MQQENKIQNAKSLKELLIETDNPLREKAKEMRYQDFLRYIESVSANEDISDFVDVDEEDFKTLLSEE